MNLNKKDIHFDKLLFCFILISIYNKYVYEYCNYYLKLLPIIIMSRENFVK